MVWAVFHALLVSVLFGGFGSRDVLRTGPFDVFAPPAHAMEAAPQGPSAKDEGRNLSRGPVKIDPDSLGVVLKAPSAALVDTASGQVLFSEGEDRIVPIASITKLMTALVVLDAGPDWERRVTMEAGDDLYEGLPYLKTGETLSVRDLFNVAMAGSVNSAAMALARSTGMTRAQFIERMNAKALEIGLAHTAFADPTGYLPENASTALDVARLAYRALERQEIRDALTRKDVVVRFPNGVERKVPATNALLGSFLNEGEYRIVGGKTGYTEEAGYTLTLRAQNGSGDVIGVVLGAPTSEDRFQDLKSLLAWGFRVYRW